MSVLLLCLINAPNYLFYNFYLLLYIMNDKKQLISGNVRLKKRFPMGDKSEAEIFIRLYLVENLKRLKRLRRLKSLRNL